MRRTMIAVTGASGKLGSLVIEALCDVVSPSGIAALARSPDKIRGLAARGVDVRQADYGAPETLRAALAGVRRLLLVSGTDVGKRVEQHGAVIEAAKAAGVEHLVYTSLLRAETSTMSIAADHAATEALIRTSGIPFTILRNGWYIENYTERLATPLMHGGFIGCARDGKIAAATRADFAAAAAKVLTTAGHEGRVYELAGDTRFTMTELATAVSSWADKQLSYREVAPVVYARVLLPAGLPPWVVEILVETDLAIANGELDSADGELHRLIGRRTETLEAVLARTSKPGHPAAWARV